MEIVVITYGKEEMGESFSAISFTEETEAINFCRIINKLELKDTNWIHAQRVKENIQYPLNLPLGIDIILNLDNTAIRLLLQKLDTATLAHALKGAAAEIQNKIFSNMSKRAAGMLQEDIEYLGQTSAGDIHEAQEKIIEILRGMEANGDIISVPNGTDTNAENEDEMEDDDNELDLS